MQRGKEEKKEQRELNTSVKLMRREFRREQTIRADLSPLRLILYLACVGVDGMRRRASSLRGALEKEKREVGSLEQFRPGGVKG